MGVARAVGEEKTRARQLETRNMSDDNGDDGESPRPVVTQRGKTNPSPLRPLGPGGRKVFLAHLAF